MPTVFLKSNNKQSISDSFIIPGFIDSKQQGVDLDNVFESYKLTPTNDMKKKWINTLAILVRSMLKRGRILEKEFDGLDYLIDTDSSNREYPLLGAFLMRHSSQQCTIMKNPELMSNFFRASQLLQVNDSATIEQETLQQKHTQSLCSSTMHA